MASALPLSTNWSYGSASGLTNQFAVASSCSIAGVFGNLPVDAVISGLTQTEVIGLASAFGICLQHVASSVPYHAYAGLSSQLRGTSFAGSINGPLVNDSFFLTGDIINLLCSSPALVAHLLPSAGTASTGATAGQQSTLPMTSRIAALPLLRSLYESRLDLDLWSGKKKYRHWYTLSRELWDDHLPYDRYDDDHWLCSSVLLFGAEGVPGSRYFEIWRRMIALDAVNAFVEAGVLSDPNSHESRTAFDRFRNTVLNMGTAQSTRDAFRAFRGRDPLPSFLCDSIKLNSNHKLTLPSSTSQFAVNIQ